MSAWTKRVAKVLPNNGKLVEIISKNEATILK